MTLLPIVVRELRVTARSRSFYRVRFWTAVASIVFAGYLLLVYSNMRLGGFGAGRMAFDSISGLGLFYCIILARNTADCVSEEKREGTLGLLFLTDLKGYDVALGKLCANSVKSLYALLATVPVVGCALVLGGVSGLEVWRTMLALLNVFFFSHAAGLVVSTHSRQQRRAAGGTAILLLAYFIGIPALVAFLQYKHFPGTAGLLELLDPADAYRQAGAVGTRFDPYWISLLLVHFNAWLFLALASLSLPRCWQDKPVNTNSPWKARMRQWCYGPPATREALRQQLIGINPFLWLVSRNRLGQIAVWGVLGLIGCGWVLIWGLAGLTLSDSMPLFVMIILLNHGLLKFWIASEACYHLSEQRHSGALEYLLSCTPLSVREILGGQWEALRRRFFWPMIAVLVADVALMAVSFSPAARNDADDLAFFDSCVAAAMAMLLTDALAIGWLGMWRAMTEKKGHTAAGSTIIRIVILPWLILSLIGALAPSSLSKYFVLVLWLFLGIGIDIGYAGTAQQHLLTRFRAQAAVQPDESPGILGQLGRLLGKMTR